MGLYSADPPKPPDYAAATREGVEADIESLPVRKLIEAAARQGTKVTYTDMSGKEKTVDFTGFGDADMRRKSWSLQIRNLGKCVMPWEKPPLRTWKVVMRWPPVCGRKSSKPRERPSLREATSSELLQQQRKPLRLAMLHSG